MKKVLFTTTALVAFAGAASAEVTLSGYAEMGIKGGTGMETQFHNDIDVKFSLSGETDGGLTFGATIDLDEVSTSQEAGGMPGAKGPVNKSSVFISGAFGTVTLGDTDGALDWAMQEVGIGSALTDDHTTHAGFNGNGGLDGSNDGQVLRYDYSFNAFSVALSAEMEDTNTAGSDTTWGIGIKYNTTLGGVELGLGLGYQSGKPVTRVAGADAKFFTTDDVVTVGAKANIWGVSVDAKFAGGFRTILNYSDLDGKGGFDKHVGLGVGYSSGPLTVSANYGKYDGVLPAADKDGYGVAVNYDLGGGAVVMAGYGKSNPTGAPSTNTWSLGLGLSF